jgi:hypothetical protein
MELKAGMQLRSAVGTAEIVVVKAPPGSVDLTSGGVSMVLRDVDIAPAETVSGHEGELLLGKRYSNETGTIEVLCSKPGPGSLALDAQPLQLKTAKPLPSSD